MLCSSSRALDMFIDITRPEVIRLFLKGGSKNSGVKRLVISMVEEAWLSNKKEVVLRSFLARQKTRLTSDLFAIIVLRGCTLNLVDHLFKIDLMPIELGSFDVVVRMDWLVKYDVVIVCGQKYIERGCHLFLAHVTEKEPTKRHIEDVPVIRDFPEVFPDDLPGLPPTRQVEFRIELVPGAASVARAPYRLTPTEMKELSVQLQELLEKGFIRQSPSP
ncbi:hypothetical protein Tco_0766025 [Tanacetum coccineum]